MKSLLEALARELVSEPRRVSVHESVEAGATHLTLRVARVDRGRVIGRGGRTADALRCVLSAVAARRGLECDVEVE